MELLIKIKIIVMIIVVSVFEYVCMYEYLTIIMRMHYTHNLMSAIASDARSMDETPIGSSDRRAFRSDDDD